MSIKSVSPRTIRKVVEYLETELGLEVIGSSCSISDKVIAYNFGMGCFDVERILALRQAKMNGAEEIGPNHDD